MSKAVSYLMDNFKKKLFKKEIVPSGDSTFEVINSLFYQITKKDGREPLMDEEKAALPIVHDLIDCRMTVYFDTDRCKLIYITVYNDRLVGCSYVLSPSYNQYRFHTVGGNFFDDFKNKLFDDRRFIIAMVFGFEPPEASIEAFKADLKPVVKVEVNKVPVDESLVLLESIRQMREKDAKREQEKLEKQGNVMATKPTSEMLVSAFIAARKDNLRKEGYEFVSDR